MVVYGLTATIDCTSTWLFHSCIDDCRHSSAYSALLNMQARTGADGYSSHCRDLYVASLAWQDIVNCFIVTSLEKNTRVSVVACWTGCWALASICLTSWRVPTALVVLLKGRLAAIRSLPSLLPLFRRFQPPGPSNRPLKEADLQPIAA